MTDAFFSLRLNITTGGLNWDENGSIGSHDLKIRKKFRHRKNSQPLPNTAPWWTNQPKSNIKKTPPAKTRPISFRFGYLKITKMKKMGCFSGFKRATVLQRQMIEGHGAATLEIA